MTDIIIFVVYIFVGIGFWGAVHERDEKDGFLLLVILIFFWPIEVGQVLGRNSKVLKDEVSGD